MVYRNEQWRSAGNMMNATGLTVYGTVIGQGRPGRGTRSGSSRAPPSSSARNHTTGAREAANGSAASSKPRTLPGSFHQCAYSFQLGHFWIPSLPGHASPDNLPVCYSKCANHSHVFRMSFPRCENGNMRQPVSVEDLTSKSSF
jgi:hypothetical protein